MKKRAVLLALIAVLILTIPLILTQDDNSQTTDNNAGNTASEDNVEKAYTCLKTKVEDKSNCNDLTPEEAAFSLLALAYDSSSQSDCKSSLLDKSQDNKCWPKNGCKIKETALALLALENIHGDTDDIKSWLLGKNKTPDLIWYIQIDTDEESDCTISYGGGSHNIKIKEDKKLSGDPGGCLSLARDNYWLQISSSCINNVFTISCDKDFKTTLSYQKSGSATIYVSSLTNSASADGTTEEKVNALCFGTNACDYEGSLWAALALSKAGEDVSTFIPYLTAFAEDNKKYIPESFLYILTSDDSYFQSLTSSVKDGGKYWEESNNKYYDTALAMSALTTSSFDSSAVKSWLFEVQNNEGCWQNSIRDTAFLLYALWPKTPFSGGVETGYCSDAGGYCITQDECMNAGGSIFHDYVCVQAGAVCCTKNISLKTCSEQGAVKCQPNESCNGIMITASDNLPGEVCCKGVCEEEVPPTPGPTCEDKMEDGWYCDYICLEEDEEKESFSNTCPSGKICCGPKPKTNEGSPWWIWLLIILILLLILAIIFRKKLKSYFGKFGSGKGRKPPSPPSSGIRLPTHLPSQRILPRRILPTRVAQPTRRPLTRPSPQKNKEVEETLKKLKEMGKD